MIDREELLRTTLAHEYHRCTKSLNRFIVLMTVLPSNNTREARLECYGAYVDFISHLYEFYKGNIIKSDKYKRIGEYEDYPSFKGLKKKGDESKVLDIIINEEIEKLYRNRKARVLRGEKDPWAPNPSFYDISIPKDFGMHFRQIRNLRNHADYRRASNDIITLNDFFNLYHKFILVLYMECMFAWKINVNNYDWKDIDDFALKILEKHQ